MSLALALHLFYQATRRWPRSMEEINRLRRRFPSQDAFTAHVRANYNRRTSGGGRALPSWAMREMRRELGADAAYLTVPDLAPIIIRAAGEGWSSDKLRAQVESTSWWNRHTQQQQEWLRLSGAEQTQALQRTAVQVLDTLRQIYGVAHATERGWTLESDFVQVRARAIASGRQPFEMFLFNNRSIAEGIENTPAWNALQAEMREAGASRVAMENLAGELEDTWRTWMGDMIEAPDMARWAERIFTNQASMEEFEDYLSRTAQSLYPNKPEHIPYSTWIAPARQMIGSMLELGDVRDDDPLLQSYVRGDYPSLADLSDRLRHDPRFQRTERFATQSRDATHTILQAFGLR